MLGLLGLAALGTVLADWSLADVLGRADLVVVGTIGAQRSVVDGEQVFTETTVHVEELLRGAAHEAVVLSQLGGTHGAVRSGVVGDARLVPGARMLLATYRHGDGRRYLVGMALGAYFVAGEHVVQRLDAGTALLEGRGALRPAPAVRVFTVDEVRRLVAP